MRGCNTTNPATRVVSGVDVGHFGGESEDSLGRGERVVPDVAADGLLEGAGKGLEDGLYLVVLVVALGLDVQVHCGGVAE